MSSKKLQNCNYFAINFLGIQKTAAEYTATILIQKHQSAVPGDR